MKESQLIKKILLFMLREQLVMYLMFLNVFILKIKLRVVMDYLLDMIFRLTFRNLLNYRLFLISLVFLINQLLR